MPRLSQSPETSDDVARLRAREATLRARIASLEAQLSLKDASQESGATTSERRRRESTRDNSSRGIDELSRLLRGLTLGSIEALHTTVDALDTTVNRIYERNQPDQNESVLDLVTRLPSDTVDALADGFAIVVDAPSRAVDKLHDTYREGRQTHQRRETRHGHAEPSVEDESQRIRDALGRPVTRVIFDPQDNIILNVGDVITNKAVAQARLSAVLDILLDSVSTQQPTVTAEGLSPTPESPMATVEFPPS